MKINYKTLKNKGLKILTILLITGFVFLSCENNNSEELNNKEFNFKKVSKNNSLKYIENQYLTSDGFNKKSEKNIINDEMYEVNVKSSGLSFYISNISDDLNLDKSFKTEVLSVNIPYDIKGNKVNTGFILRNITKRNIKITEVLSPKTGKIISYNLEGISENDYIYIKNKYTENKSQSRKGDRTVCFTTFKACTQELSDGNGSSLDAALCDVLWCNVMAYIACTGLELQGAIEESDCFTSCANCDVIIGER